jgi:hypothetical protein
MTPPITKAIMASRPLYDPDPDTFVARDIVKDLSMRRVRLSDFVVVALQINIRAGVIKHAEADVFENVFVRGAKPRLIRVHEGHPARAPDNSIMSHLDAAYPGSTGEAAGPYSTQDVETCAGYETWLKRITQSEEDLVARGIDVSRKNQPLPDPATLEEANALVLKKMSSRQSLEAKAREDGSDDERSGAGSQRARSTARERRSAKKGKSREVVQDSGEEDAESEGQTGAAAGEAAKERVRVLIAKAESTVARAVFRIAGLGNILGNKERAAMTLKLDRKLSKRMRGELAFAWKEFPERKPAWMAEERAGTEGEAGVENEPSAAAQPEAGVELEAGVEGRATAEPAAGVENELETGVEGGAAAEPEEAVEESIAAAVEASIEPSAAAEQEVGIDEGVEAETGVCGVRSTDAGSGGTSESSAGPGWQGGKRGGDEGSENGEVRPKKHARHHTHSSVNPG